MGIRKYAPVFLGLCIAASGQAQSDIRDNLIPYRKGDLWGFCDSTKQMIVPPEYNSVKIINTLLLEGKDHMTVYQDIYTVSGKKLHTFNQRGDFKNGYAIVAVTGKYGLMDTTGRLVVSPKYAWMRDCREGMVICGNQPEESIVVDSTGREVATVTGSVSAFYNGHAFIDAKEKHGSIDKKGNIIWFRSDYMFPSPNIDHGYIRIVSKESHGYGLVDMNEKVIVPPDHAGVEFSGGGTIKVRIREQYGLYDTSGKLLLPVTYNKISPVEFDLHLNLPPHKRHWRTYFIVEKDTLRGMIDSAGTFIVPVEYRYISPVSEDIFEVSTKNYKHGHFHISGRVVTPLIYREVGPFIDGISWVKENDKIQLVNENGWFINKVLYDKVVPHPRVFGDSVILVEKDKRIGVVAHDGKERISCSDYAYAYSSIHYYEPQRLRVSIGTLRGMTDLYNKIILPVQYSWIGSFSEDGYAWALRKGKYVIVDLDGHETVPPDECLVQQGHTKFHNGVSEVTIGGKQMYVNTSGQVLQANLKGEKLVQHGRSWFVVQVGGKCGVLDNHGQLVVPVKYEGIADRVTERLYIVRQNGQNGYAGTNGIEYFED